MSTSTYPRAYRRGGRNAPLSKERTAEGREAIASRKREQAEEALQSILSLFESGELPSKIAQTVIARHEGEAPMATWSLPNQLLVLLAGSADARGFRQWKEVGRHVRKG